MKKDPTMTPRHGVDVAVTRADDLDKKILANLQAKTNPSVLDLGCGAGGQSARMVQVGANVTACDQHDYIEAFSSLRESLGATKDQLRFMQINATDVHTVLKDQFFTDVIVQRMIHYVPYEQALVLLQFLHECVNDRLYISVTGMESEVAKGYVSYEKELSKRFAGLNTEAADTFNIHEPVCLYAKTEFKALLESAGWRVDEIWSSAFGNHKAVCRK